MHVTYLDMSLRIILVHLLLKKSLTFIWLLTFLSILSEASWRLFDFLSDSVCVRCQMNCLAVSVVNCTGLGMSVIGRVVCISAVKDYHC